jgi:hypothetical protein
VRIPACSPNQNAVVECFHGTILQECWRPAFHRRRFTSRRQLQATADAWLISYNHRRRNHSHYMRGRAPHQVLNSYPPIRHHDHQPQSPSVTSNPGLEDLERAAPGLKCVESAICFLVMRGPQSSQIGESGFLLLLWVSRIQWT